MGCGHAWSNARLSRTGRPGQPLCSQPDRVDLPGTGHHLLIFGAAEDAAVAQVASKWHDLVDITRSAGDGRQAERTASVAVLVRPDGHIGFRAARASQAGLRALDAHLNSYLVPA